MNIQCSQLFLIQIQIQKSNKKIVALTKTKLKTKVLNNSEVNTSREALNLVTVIHYSLSLLSFNQTYCWSKTTIK